MKFRDLILEGTALFSKTKDELISGLDEILTGSLDISAKSIKANDDTKEIVITFKDVKDADTFVEEMMDEGYMSIKAFNKKHMKNINISQSKNTAIIEWKWMD